MTLYEIMYVFMNEFEFFPELIFTISRKIVSLSIAVGEIIHIV